MPNFLPGDLPRVVGESAPLIAVALRGNVFSDAVAISYLDRGVLVQARTEETKIVARTGLKDVKEAFIKAGWDWTVRYGSDSRFGMFFTPAWITTSREEGGATPSSPYPSERPRR